jgi:hypothetical protein
VQTLTIGGAGDRTIDTGAGADNITLTTNGLDAAVVVDISHSTAEVGEKVIALGAGPDYTVNLLVGTRVDGTGSTQDVTFNGSDENDTIITGAGADTVNLSNGGSDRYVFQETAVNNGADTVTHFDVLNDTLSLNEFLGGAGAFFDGAVHPTDNSSLDISWDVALFDDDGTYDATNVAAEFAGGAGFSLDDGAKAVVITGDDDAAATAAKVWFVHDANGNGTVATEEVALVATISAGDAGTGLDLDTLDSGNFVL